MAAAEASAAHDPIICCGGWWLQNPTSPDRHGLAQAEGSFRRPRLPKADLRDDQIIFPPRGLKRLVGGGSVETDRAPTSSGRLLWGGLTMPFGLKDQPKTHAPAGGPAGALVFVAWDLSDQTSVLSIPLQAVIRPLTASTDLSNMTCSSLVSLISTIFSMPPAPMIVGTPTYMFFRPNSPSQ